MITEIIDGIFQLEICSKDNKRILVNCDSLERFQYGIVGFKRRYFDKVQTIIINTNVIKESEEDWKKRGKGVYKSFVNETCLPAEFNSIKEVLDSLGVIIHWKK
jgi:hypothetical protein